MHRTRSRRSHGLLQAFRQWAPWIAQLALAAVLNAAFDGPARADEIGRRRALEASLVEAERLPAPPSLDELVALLTPALERALAPHLPAQQDAGTISEGTSKSRLRRDHPLAPSPTRTPTHAGEGEPPWTAGPGGGLPLPGERVGERGIGSNREAPLSRVAGVRVGEGTGVRVPATVQAAAPAPQIPPPPSLPGLPQQGSGGPVTSAAEAAPASGEGVPLLPGWNLISLPRPPDSVDPAAVFSSIAGSYTIVHSYDACDAEPWRTWDPAAPGAS